VAIRDEVALLVLLAGGEGEAEAVAVGVRGRRGPRLTADSSAQELSAGFRVRHHQASHAAAAATLSPVAPSSTDVAP